MLHEAHIPAEQIGPNTMSTWWSRSNCMVPYVPFLAVQ